ncbi:hypothetical protein MMC17_009292 [Xylographa soralifera]|nr:hypothetical protein [Xylographa soralifera]
MRSEDIKSHWPEYEVLKNLKAQKFTLALEPVCLSGDRCIEFDRNYGAYPGLTKSMQFHSAPEDRPFTPSSVHEDSESPIWQDTDTLVNKTIPLYNFLREFFHNNIYLKLPEERLGEMPVQNSVTFPIARKSTGSIMRDCAFCYLSERHCGHHAVPDQPPFEPKHLTSGGLEENAKTLETRYQDLSYVDMREACRSMFQQILDTNVPERLDLLNAFTVFEYIGWFEMPISECLIRLDAAVEVGWTGNRVDKEEVPPWDMLYREVRSWIGFA